MNQTKWHRARFREAPRQLLRPLRVAQEEIAWRALNACEYHARGLRPVQPLAAAEADRPRLRGATEVVAIHAAARG